MMNSERWAYSSVAECLPNMQTSLRTKKFRLTLVPNRGYSKVVKLATLVIHCSTDQHLASKVVFPFLEIAGQTTLSFTHFKE